MLWLYFRRSRKLPATLYIVCGLRRVRQAVGTPRAERKLLSSAAELQGGGAGVCAYTSGISSCPRWSEGRPASKTCARAAAFSGEKGRGEDEVQILLGSCRADAVEPRANAEPRARAAGPALAWRSRGRQRRQSPVPDHRMQILPGCSQRARTDQEIESAPMWRAGDNRCDAGTG